MSDNTVLLVDDEEGVLNSIERLFAKTGMNIIKATNGEDALEFVRKENISVVVSDNLMPGMKGLELLSKVRVISPDVVRILMTAHSDFSTAVDAINNCEVFRFITKPWDNRELINIIEEGINRYKLIMSLKKADESTLLSLAQTIELKDKYTRGHCDRVAAYALRIAERLNLSEDTKKDIRYGCWLHDCGKIGVPEHILNKKGRLNEEEFEVIKKHPVWGADVAKQAQLSQTIINIILNHHEKYDGAGYPAGLKGTDIPIEARIVAVADCFDAITSERPYGETQSFAKGMEIILSLKNSAFDSEIVDIFISSMNRDYDSPDIKGKSYEYNNR